MPFPATDEDDENESKGIGDQPLRGIDSECGASAPSKTKEVLEPIIRAREIARHVKMAGWDWNWYLGPIDQIGHFDGPVICIFAPLDVVRAFLLTVLDDDITSDRGGK